MFFLIFIEKLKIFFFFIEKEFENKIITEKKIVSS